MADAERKRLLEYNALMKENDELYRIAARTLRMSDCSFWILYALRDTQQEITQSELSAMLFLPKQTVNSALKKLEKDGYLVLQSIDQRRTKRIRLTEKGLALAQETVDRVMAAEMAALGGMSEEEQDTLLGGFRKFTELLRERLSLL